MLCKVKQKWEHIQENKIFNAAGNKQKLDSGKLEYNIA